MTQETLTAFFGWMTVLNIGFLALTALSLVIFRTPAAALHARLFDLEKADVTRAYFRYLANYKILTFIFCLMPWLALKMI